MRLTSLHVCFRMPHSYLIETNRTTTIMTYADKGRKTVFHRTLLLTFIGRRRIGFFSSICIELHSKFNFFDIRIPQYTNSQNLEAFMAKRLSTTINMTFWRKSKDEDDSCSLIFLGSGMPFVIG